MGSLCNRPGMIAVVASMLCTTTVQAAQQARCEARPAHVRTLRMPLKVNPDGAVGSYTVGDHGFTYVSNGMNLVEGGRTLPCHGTNSRYCRRQFLQAEGMAFGPGSPTFCVYAMEVAPFRPGQSLTACDPNNRDRRLIGNGQGILRLGARMPSVGGGEAQTYLSMTSLKHMIDGQAVYLDSATVPVLVSSERSLLGSIAWLRLGGRWTFAILGDSGGSFGEGSIALHQRLLYDAAPPRQALGPIPVAARCGPLESAVRAPFSSRPNPGDECRPGRTPQAEADIRGYANIEAPVDIVILEQVRLPMRSNLVLGEVTAQALAAAAAHGGFDPERLQALIDCR